ncbi:hypothetical protein CYLTODRAFT_356332 [Cylindrobasidium torrendii FP15055 ss-10]|uniref:RNase H type-1 domain-containing protein n=1 Tax=Cylindrobasidium torrendii FP15055 ss-10 TaxID=1314674 RepID=A0A0D7B6H6_9AGAR|nr:hypothetical protein CYLTODRAFT_356332 [Cylindrobasidium torrendii FP15055 ss-10]
MHIEGHILIRSDNQGVIGALQAGYSRGIQQNDILRRIVSAMQDYNIWLSLSYVNTHDNLADAPSRAVFDSRKKLLPYPPSVPYYLKPYVKNSVSYNELPP